MAETVKVRVGLASARELELEVEDGDAVAGQLEKGIADGTHLVWIVDAKGNRHGIAAQKVAFVEVDAEASRKGVGFTSVAD